MMLMAKDNPTAITARFVDIENSVEWNKNKLDNHMNAITSQNG
jgi:hypothetical protein